MFVKQLIGRQAGMVIDMAHAEAIACIDNGTAKRATEEEITLALESSAAPVHEPTRPEELLQGYRMEAADDGSGFHVFDSGGVRLTGKDDQPIPRNHPEAEEYMRRHARAARGLPEEAPQPQSGDSAVAKPGDPVDYKKNTVEEMQEMAKTRNLDGSKAIKKADWVALLERDDRVQKALQDLDYAVLTVDELKKVAADRKIDLGGSNDKSEIIEKIKAADPK